jgi:NAD(P)-dependent dehydrogenase (short-subunit alcohol dehydrogenase family)
LDWDLKRGAAVITGAASGIGRALANRLATEGMSLAIADIDEPGLQETTRQVSAKKAFVSAHIVNVADANRMEEFAVEVVARHDRVTLLVNNAGVALHGTFEEISLADFEWLMQINFWGVVYGVKNFLPILRRQPRAHIVNLSSIFGMVSPAGQTAYCASKFAIRGFTEALTHELEGTTVGISCVHPGGIRTPIARKARRGASVDPAKSEMNVALFERLAPTSPDAAAHRIVDGVKRGEPRILVGADAVRMDRLQRLFPIRYWNMLRKQIEKTASQVARSSKG